MSNFKSVNSHKNEEPLTPTKPKRKFKFKKLNQKSIIYLMVGSLCSIVFFVSLITSAFGLGYQSYIFSSRTRLEISNHIDKTHIIFDPKVMDGVNNTVIATILKESYLIDATSTLTASQLLNKAKFDSYVAFAETGFYKDWVSTGYITANAIGLLTIQKPINLNTFALTLLNFDLSVGKKFVAPLVTTGLSWIFTEGGYSNLISTNWKQHNYYHYVHTMGTVVNENQYQIKMNAFADMMLLDSALGINYNKTVFTTFLKDNPQDPGFNLVNNKLWFTNWQIQKLKTLLQGNGSTNFLSTANATYYQDNPSSLSYLKLSDFYSPNYQQAYFQARVGAIMLTIVTPIIIATGIALTLLMRFFVVYDRNQKKLLFQKRFGKNSKNIPTTPNSNS